MPRDKNTGHGGGRKDKNTSHRTKSKRQVAFLLSSGSPLTVKEKDKLKGELSSGAVTIKG